MNNGNAKATF